MSEGRSRTASGCRSQTRMAQRAVTTDHVMPVTLPHSQYATLEPLADDEAGVTIDLRRSSDELADDCVAYLRG